MFSFLTQISSCSNKWEAALCRSQTCFRESEAILQGQELMCICLFDNINEVIDLIFTRV